MISVPVGMGDLPCGYDICFADDIRFAYEWNGYYIIRQSRISYRANDISLKNKKQ